MRDDGEGGASIHQELLLGKLLEDADKAAGVDSAHYTAGA